MTNKKILHLEHDLECFKQLKDRDDFIHNNIKKHLTENKDYYRHKK